MSRPALLPAAAERPGIRHAACGRRYSRRGRRCATSPGGRPSLADLLVRADQRAVVVVDVATAVLVVEAGRAPLPLLVPAFRRQQSVRPLRTDDVYLAAALLIAAQGAAASAGVAAETAPTAMPIRKTILSAFMITPKIMIRRRSPTRRTGLVIILGQQFLTIPLPIPPNVAEGRRGIRAAARPASTGAPRRCGRSTCRWR